jgi:hypothetical protein
MIVINKETGKQLENVLVVDESVESYRYCRYKADEFFKKAEILYEKEVEPRYKLLREIDYSLHGEELDKELERYNTITAEKDAFLEDYFALNELGGEWEDKEFKAMLMPLLKLTSNLTENPNLALACKLEMTSLWLNDLGLPNLANQFFKK